MIGKGKDEGPGIYQYIGNTLEKISTEAIDTYLGAMALSDIQDAYAMSFSIDGAFFVCFSLVDTTFFYNLANQKWLEIQSTINGDLEKWRVASIATAYGKTYVGDTFDGRIGYFDKTNYGEYGTDLQKVFTCEVMDSEGDPFALTKVELTMESGAGPAILIPAEIEREYVIVNGTPTITGDTISMLKEATSVYVYNYWEIGVSYIINCTIADYNGTGSVVMPISNPPGTVVSGSYFAPGNGNYTYEYIPADTTMRTGSGGQMSANITINSIVQSELTEIEPQISMEVSKDGKQFNYPLYRSMGKEGETNKRQIWRSIPNFDRFGILKFRVSDQVITRILKLEVE